MLGRILIIVVAAFPVSEIALALAKRSRRDDGHSEDRGSLRLLWISIAVGVGLAMAAQVVRAGRLPGSRVLLGIVALTLLITGLAVRWAAILTLGRLFTVDVAIQSDHHLVRSGLYRRVRHPSYTGLLMAFIGLGVFFGNWLSLLALMIPIGLGVANRIAKEERALLAALGPAYADYCRHTRRLIPGLL